MTTTRTVNDIPPGIYTVQAFLWSDSCRVAEKTIYLGFKPITIPNARVLGGCNGSVGSAVLVAPATQGSGTYTYTLFQGSVDAANQVAGPQSSSVFSNVSPGVQYIVVATDECGSGTQRTASAVESSYPVGTSASRYCPGDNMTLSVINVAGATYQWFKDGNPISSQTGYQLTINNVLYPADNGIYSANIYIQDCVLASSTVNIVVDCKPFPVTLADFRAAGMENYVQLEWETTFESQSSGFAIERSRDGKTWESVGMVESATKGDLSYNIQTYSYQDYDPIAGIVLYRLKCIDLDGTYTYSRVRSVHLKGEIDPVVFPNPTSRRLIIKNVSSNAKFTLIDASGRPLPSLKTVNYEKGVATLDVSHIRTGIHILQVSQQESVKLML